MLSPLPPANVQLVDDLCALVEQGDPRLQEWASAGNSLIIIACYNRAVRSLFEYAGARLAADATVINARVSPLALVAKHLAEFSPEQALSVPEADEPAPIAADPWMPWYPVIDRSRCVNCRKCMSFCLFGVYSLIEQQVRVSRPRNCKNNCPACARICPEAAIIFPKCKDEPINGADITPAHLESKDLRVDLTAISGAADIYTELRKRAAQAQGGQQTK